MVLKAFIFILSTSANFDQKQITNIHFVSLQKYFRRKIIYYGKRTSNRVANFLAIV